MTSAIGFINVQLVIQNTLKFDLPLVYNLKKERWMPNPKNEKRWTMPIWHIANFIIFILYIYCILYIPLLIRWAGSLSNVDPELLFTHSLFLILVTQALVTAHLFEWDPAGVSFMENSIYDMMGIKHLGWPSRKRLADTPEILCYVMAGGFALFPFVTALWPILRSHDPVTKFLSLFITTKTIIRILASCVYIFITTYAAIACVSVVILCMSTSHIFEILTLEIYHQSAGTFHKPATTIPEMLFYRLNVILVLLHSSIKYIKKKRKTFSDFMGNADSNDKSNENENRKSLPTIPDLVDKRGDHRRTFGNIYHFHRQIRLMMRISNTGGQVFVPVMTADGMAVCVLMTCAIIKIFNYMDKAKSLGMESISDDKEIRKLVMYGYIFVFGGIVGSITGLILFFSNHASKSLVYSVKYIKFWRSCQYLPKICQKQARSMSEIQYTFGPFFKVTKDLRIEIIYQTIDFIVSLLVGSS